MEGASKAVGEEGSSRESFHGLSYGKSLAGASAGWRWGPMVRASRLGEQLGCSLTRLRATERDDPQPQSSLLDDQMRVAVCWLPLE